MLKRIMILMTISQIGYTQQEINSTEDMIKEMMSRNKINRVDSYTFIQETYRYDEDGNKGDVRIWYEAIQYPDKFRIDYGDKEEGNAVIYRNDSVYVFRDGGIVHSGKEYQEFLLIEGGMYQYDSHKEVLERLTEFGYDINKFYKTEYNGDKVYVFGAEKDNYNDKQMWIDRDHFFIRRKFSKMRNGKMLETKYDNFKKIEGHWIETKVSFLVENRLIQDEYYTHIDMGTDLNPIIYDPDKVWKHYWYED